MRLIDADALMEDLQYDVELDARALDSVDIVGDREVIQFDKDCKQNCIDLLLNAPTVDPVKHGRWKKAYADHVAFGERPLYRYCSECCEVTVFPYKFCPHCGAKMDEEG